MDIEQEDIRRRVLVNAQTHVQADWAGSRGDGAHTLQQASRGILAKGVIIVVTCALAESAPRGNKRLSDPAQ